MAKNTFSKIDYDVAIIGGGIAGCFAAYRLINSKHINLAKNKVNLTKIALFEQKNRIGGRLFSQRYKDVVFEYGGMRFFEEITILKDLLIHLNLKDDIVDFKVREQDNIFYTRGKSYKVKEIKSAKLPYNLKSTEKGKTSDELIIELINKIIPSFNILRSEYHSAIKEKDWETVKNKSESYTYLKDEVLVNLKKLTNLSWYELLQDFLSEEAIDFIQDFEGYEIKESNGNASNWLDNIFYTPQNVQLKKLASGFTSITNKLISHFEKSGGKTILNSELIEINKLDNAYELKFKKGNKIECKTCKIVILTSPKISLKKIKSSLLNVPNYNNALSSIKGVDAFKLFLVYSNPWWKKLGISEGLSTTDLPLRQVRYHHSSNGTAVIMASYCNGSDITYWSSLDKKEIVKEAHKQLIEMHNCPEIPFPINAFYKFWSEISGTSGWHVWKPDFNNTENIELSIKPNKKEDIYIVGSAWSNEPGSVQGAIRSVETLLQNHFKIPSPNWMDNEHFSRKK